jgi:cysteine desulfurase/selenocysteine lyase
VDYAELPWRFTAGTPNIMGSILAGEVTELIPDLVLGSSANTGFSLERKNRAMDQIQRYEQRLTQFLIDELTAIRGVTVYGSKDARRKTPVISFNIEGFDALDLARCLDMIHIESRAGCHCATLAHYYLGIDPPASCRISPYFYNTMEEMVYIVDMIRMLAEGAVPAIALEEVGNPRYSEQKRASRLHRLIGSLSL